MPSELQPIKVHSNHFMSCTLIVNWGFKAFPFFSADPYLQLNQVLNWSTGLDLCGLISTPNYIMFFGPRGSSLTQMTTVMDLFNVVNYKNFLLMYTVIIF